MAVVVLLRFGNLSDEMVSRGEEDLRPRQGGLNKAVVWETAEAWRFPERCCTARLSLSVTLFHATGTIHTIPCADCLQRQWKEQRVNNVDIAKDS